MNAENKIQGLMDALEQSVKDARAARERHTARETCDHGVTLGFACNECSVRAGRTMGVSVADGISPGAAGCNVVGHPQNYVHDCGEWDAALLRRGIQIPEESE